MILLAYTGQMGLSFIYTSFSSAWAPAIRGTRRSAPGNAVPSLPALACPLWGNAFPAPGSCPPFPLTTHGNGTKNSLMGKTLRLNASAFHFNYKGYQGSQFTSATSSGSGVFNVGDAKIFGLEGNATALVGQDTRINLNATSLYTKFGDGITINTGASTPVAIDISGNRLPNAPDFTASGGVEQEIPVSWGKFTARINAKYSSAFYYSVLNTADTQSKEYVLANASLKFAPAESFWKIQGYVRNVFNKQVLANANQNFNAGANIYEFQTPRTFGVRGSVKF